MHIFRHIAQNPLEIRQDSCAAFAQSDEKSDGLICTSDLIRASLISEMCKFIDKECLEEIPFENFVDINSENDASGNFSVSLKFKDFTHLEFNIGEWILENENTGEFEPELM